MPTPFNGEQLRKREKAKETANNIAGYFNQMEMICASPMSEQEKAEAFNQMALYLGKAMVAFVQFCEDVGINEERGVRGGVIRGKKKSTVEEQYDFVEEN